MRALILILMTMLPFAATAAPAEDLARFIDGVHSLSAEFKQVQSDEKGRVLSTSSGRMWLSRPGRFRWAYEKPYEQLMVCDGKTLWMYEPDLDQVTVRPAAEALRGTPASLLSQKSTLTDAFTLQDGGGKGGVRTVRLKPKSGDSDFRMIELTLSEGIPQKMKFFDQLGGSSVVSFSKIKANIEIEAGRFQFVAPKGVEVVEAGSSQ